VYLVTGCGDGGLTDAIRLSIRAFKHDEFIYRLSRLENLETFKKHLSELDTEVAAELDAEPLQDKSLRAARESGLLEDSYRRLEIPAAFQALVTQELRNDTVVYLNGPTLSPFSLASSVLNRIIVHVLREAGKLRYRQGQIDAHAIEGKGPFRIRFSNSEFFSEDLEIDQVVVRHGPEPAIRKLLPKDLVEDGKPTPSESIEDRTRERLYPESFLDLPFLRDQKMRVSLRYAAKLVPFLIQSHFNASLHSQISIEVEQGVTGYVFTRNGSEPTSAEPGSFLGFPVRVVELPTKADSYVTESPSIPSQFVLRPGSPIFIKGSNGKRFKVTAGVIVKDVDGRVAILTSALDKVMKGDLVTDEKGRAVARIMDFTELIIHPPQSSALHEHATANRNNGIFAPLVPGVRFESQPKVNEKEAESTKLPRFAIDQGGSVAVGTHVFKVGASSQLTYGNIVGVKGSINLPTPIGAAFFNDVAVVTGLATPGDIGAAVATVEEGVLIGLIIGQSPAVTFLAPINPLFDRFRCSLIDD